MYLIEGLKDRSTLMEYVEDKLLTCCSQVKQSMTHKCLTPHSRDLFIVLAFLNFVTLNQRGSICFKDHQKNIDKEDGHNKKAFDLSNVTNLVPNLHHHLPLPRTTTSFCRTGHLLWRTPTIFFGEVRSSSPAMVCDGGYGDDGGSGDGGRWGLRWAMVVTVLVDGGGSCNDGGQYGGAVMVAAGDVLVW
ncbi:hypothetical protein OSB04_016444 [Centaurea solstitialis]|uniref:Uncharacterized protein n=1 Tax=Centaurea solstitialis TaxID=347529 RepID=A0AA38T2K8_9ASTR|nr:hypothetical protein OSB04_016444 [Centaurea solstitialis]